MPSETVAVLSPDEAWIRHVVCQHRPIAVERVEHVEHKPPKREKDEPCSGGLPAKAIKKEPQDLQASRGSQAAFSGREVSKCLLRNLPFRALDASMLDIGQVLRGCLAVARNFPWQPLA